MARAGQLATRLKLIMASFFAVIPSTISSFKSSCRNKLKSKMQGCSASLFSF